jgi:hypothetical protein
MSHAHDATATLARRASELQRLNPTLSLSAAVAQVAREDRALVDQHLAQFETSGRPAAPATLGVVSLRRDGESFIALAHRVAAERQIHLSQAIRIVSAAHPDLADAYARG